MRIRTIVIVVSVGLAVGVTRLTGRSSESGDFTVHEWGTFTSIAGADGRPMSWRPLSGPSDLPSFVAQCGGNLKGALVGTVRMETPVIYFYATDELTVSVGVDFPKGVITDWFPAPTIRPDAAVVPGGAFSFSRISWQRVHIAPALSPEFPTEPGPSHYYAARETNASPLQVAHDRERFLFYRGVGQFAPSLNARVLDDGSVVVKSADASPIGTLVAFENRGGRVAHRTYRDIGWEQTLVPLTLDDESDGPGRELVEILTTNGLHRREAEAMVATWRDSWFEEGARLFYIAPRSVVDDILPLTVTPAPRSIARVFVGRMELVTPTTRRDVTDALLTGNQPVLRAYGRFLEPIAERIIAAGDVVDRALLDRALKTAVSRALAQTSSCR